MKLKILLLLSCTTSALMGQSAVPPTSAATPPPNFAMPSGPIAPADAASPTTAPSSSDPDLPSANFAPSRYESLWTKSPFAVETAEESVGDDSPDYLLVGIARDQSGVYFASLIARQNQEHFLISSDKPTHGLTLNNITRSHDGADTYATVVKDGQTLTLKLQQAAPVAAQGGQPGMPTPMPGGAPFSAPGTIIPNIQMPGSSPSQMPGSMRPFPRNHRPTIHLPNLNQQPQAPPTAPQPQPTAPPAH
jgi:hypothetical protein